MISYRGIFTPLVTPITADEQLDLESLANLVRFQIDAGVHGLWVMGTTAEFASFDEDERAAAVETVVRVAGGRVPVVANISDASTRLALRHGRRAEAAGADALAATPPYYYPHSQDELLAHYRAIRGALDLPLFIYNIPQTVRVKVELSTGTALAAEGTVAGIKDSQNDLEWFRQLVLFVRRNEISFVPFIGTRALIDAGVQIGAAGAIPSIANIFPDLCVRVYERAAAGDFQTAREVEALLMEAESSAHLAGGGSANSRILGFLKTMLYERGIISTPLVTSPLRPLTGDEQRAISSRVDSLVTQPARS